jgi:hypothetical protein
MMRGEEDLQTLLATLSPSCQPGEFVFVTFADAVYGDHAILKPIAAVQESEGLTLVVPRQNADANGLVYESAFRCITLTVHSGLNAVGLTAAIAARLAVSSIPANVVAGFFHDHVFVPADAASDALAVLLALGRLK